MPVTVQVQGPAAVVTMDWPAVRNALTTDDMAAVAPAQTAA
jgi:enoyl-CoA hydratase/carnithine racemase